MLDVSIPSYQCANSQNWMVWIRVPYIVSIYNDIYVHLERSFHVKFNEFDRHWIQWCRVYVLCCIIIILSFFKRNFKWFQSKKINPRLIKNSRYINIAYEEILIQSISHLHWRCSSCNFFSAFSSIKTNCIQKWLYTTSMGKKPSWYAQLLN